MVLAALTEIMRTGKIQQAEEQSHFLGNHGAYIAYPETEEEIVSVLKAAHDHALTVTPMGGGTKRGCGGVEEKTDILLSLSAYKGIVEYSPGDMTMSVRSGTTINEIAEYLAAHKQMLPIDPAWPEYATIGGVAAANDSGPKRLRYGSARDLVIGLRVIYPDGRIIRTGGKVVKNVAGYDMNKLFIGSMGTLGILSEITVKLRPLSPYQSLLLLTFPTSDFANIRSFVTSLLDSMMEPVSLEFLSPAVHEKLNGQEGYALAIAFEDVEKAVRYQEDWVKTHVPNGTEIQILQQEDARHWWTLFSRLAPCGVPQTGNSESQIALRTGSRNLDVLEIVKACHEQGDRHDLIVEAHGGAGHGIARAYIKGNPKQFASYVKEIRAFVERKGGYAVVQHAPLALRRELDVWGEKPAYFSLIEGIKQAIDPQKMLNPKRFVGGI
jgi:glycolate oxidase FAD binding subunit